MRAHSRLFMEFVDIFLEREFVSAISAARQERRRDDLRLSKHAVREAERRRWALVADVADFFASVDQDKLGRQIRRKWG